MRISRINQKLQVSCKRKRKVWEHSFWDLLDDSSAQGAIFYTLYLTMSAQY